MAIPTHEQMLRPLLALSSEGDLTRRDGAAAMAEQFKLTPEERETRIPSGQQTYIRSRVGWSMTFLTKADLIAKAAPKIYRITDFGRKFLLEHPREITVRDLKAIPGWKEAWQVSKDDESNIDVTRINEWGGNQVTPIEALDNAVNTLNADLKDRLLKAILDQSSTFFEQLVLDVLQAMGYGGSREDAAEHLGRSGDEGLDGCIKQDPLGLDQIFVQAKRYAPDHVVDRQAVQAFIGALTGQGVTKGIFITTSSFNRNAKEFVQRGSHTKVVLIDGSALMDLMFRHHIGVRAERSIEVLDVDQNYFADDE